LDDKAKEGLLNMVDAWQDVIVNKPNQCLECVSELKRGQKAFRGLGAKSENIIWLCEDCIENL